MDDIVKRTRGTKQKVRSEVQMLTKINIFKKVLCMRAVETGRGKNKKLTKKKMDGWSIDTKSPNIRALTKLVLERNDSDTKFVEKRIRDIGKIKLAITSGYFVDDTSGNCPVDILIVGDGIKNSRVQSAIADIEAAIGRELQYAFFETDDFNYRLNIYDRLVRDILDYEHIILVNKLEI